MMNEKEWYINKKKRGFEYVTGADENVLLPTKGTRHSAAYDFYLPCDVVIEPKSYSDLIPLGVKAYMQDDEVLMLYVRSSIGMKKHLFLANGTGIIDADFYNNPTNEGNIGLVLFNNGNRYAVLKKGERVLQGIFMKHLSADNGNTDVERTGGVGSTN